MWTVRKLFFNESDDFSLYIMRHLSFDWEFWQLWKKPWWNSERNFTNGKFI